MSIAFIPTGILPDDQAYSGIISAAGPTATCFRMEPGTMVSCLLQNMSGSTVIVERSLDQTTFYPMTGAGSATLFTFTANLNEPLIEDSTNPIWLRYNCTVYSGTPIIFDMRQ